jgi:hypothetical protein
VDDEKTSLPFLCDQPDPLRVWDSIHTARTSRANRDTNRNTDSNSNAHIHNHTPAHHPNLHPDLRCLDHCHGHACGAGGVPEGKSHYGYPEIYIFEWDGNKFRSLIDVGVDEYTGEVIDYTSMTGEHKLLDMNEDGIKEIVTEYDNNKLCGGFGGFCDGTPTRIQTTTLSWNGKNYIDLKQNNYSPPQYRFQAVQDGDWQTSYGNYAEAVSSYQAVIFDDNLEWWSPKREEYERYNYMTQYDPTPIASPTPLRPRRIPQPRRLRLLPHHAPPPRAGTGGRSRVHVPNFARDLRLRSLRRSLRGDGNCVLGGVSVHAEMYDGCAAAIQYAVEHLRF